MASLCLPMGIIPNERMRGLPISQAISYLDPTPDEDSIYFFFLGGGGIYG